MTAAARPLYTAALAVGSAPSTRPLHTSANHTQREQPMKVSRTRPFGRLPAPQSLSPKDGDALPYVPPRVGEIGEF